ncbi:hypothetical protein L3X38_004617 [Prunus dulcis]|uniref:Uncharacterized protein n=1 Tax=Prunus dulcis TaxID=3755 RepID=A0AAD4ZPF1_PRUDU|nr:hypothetical protein L3X38_004617 [Prunus dulcis]
MQSFCSFSSYNYYPLEVSGVNTFHEAFSKFLTMYSKYQSSERIDQLRLDEYSHLSPKPVNWMAQSARERDCMLNVICSDVVGIISCHDGLHLHQICGRDRGS